MTLQFDKEGHILISPAQFLEAAKKDPSRLVSDVLCHGTPALYATYDTYRAFVHEAAEGIKVSPFGIWVRGSAQVGFSIAPRAGKVWVGVNDDSDIDLAIVDPDHYHRLDVEIRGWARTEGLDEFERTRRLSENRRYYCYRHDDLPTTPTCIEYKDKIAEVAAQSNRTVTAFFYRDYWALHDRCLKDLNDLVSQDRLGLPQPGSARRPATWLKNGELGPSLCGAGLTELNLARKNIDHRMEISDDGLAALGGLGPIERAWFDACGVGDAGIKLLGSSDRLVFLSLADTLVTDTALHAIAAKFPTLRTLVLDSTRISAEVASEFCRNSLLTALSVRRCRWPKVKGLKFHNANNAAVRVVGW